MGRAQNGGEEGVVTWASPSVERPPLSELGWDDQDPSLYFKCFYFIIVRVNQNLIKR